MSSSGTAQWIARREIGPLGHRRTHQQPAVRAAAEREALVGRQVLLDEPIRRRVEVIEDLLLVLAHAGAVPVLAFFGAAADAGVREQTAAPRRPRWRWASTPESPRWRTRRSP